MRYPLEQARCDTQACSNCTNSFQRSKERRKHPLAIARAKGGCICQLPVRSPGAAKTNLWYHEVDVLDTNYGGERQDLQRLFGQVLVSRKSSVNVCSVVSRTTDETPTNTCPKAIGRRSRHLPFQLEEMSAPRCRSQLFLFYFRPQKPFSLG